MTPHIEHERRWAAAHIEAGDPVTPMAVVVALRRSREWVYVWLARARNEEPA